MGLDTSHGCWHGAYSAFHRWRLEIARLAGVPLLLMEGYWGAPTATPTYEEGQQASALDQARAERRCFEHVTCRDDHELGRACWDRQVEQSSDTPPPVPPVPWAWYEGDPIVALLNHSDCEDSLPHAVTGPLADRLEGLLDGLPAERDPGHVGDWRITTRTFIDGLRRAHRAGEDVVFS